MKKNAPQRTTTHLENPTTVLLLLLLLLLYEEEEMTIDKIET
jgi:hypothetical protein